MLTPTPEESSISSVVSPAGSSSFNTSDEYWWINLLNKRFPDYLDRPTAPELSQQIEASLVDGADATPFYDSWSDK